MKGRKKAAIIGFGGMGQRHYQAYKKINADVVAIADLFSEKIPSVLPDFPQEHIYSDYKSLLENETVDIISVVTNGPAHAQVTIDASESGIRNILCEKPMATRLVDAERVIEICKKNNTRLSVNHIRRWSTNYSRLRQMIREGVIGDVRHLYFQCGSTGLGNFAIHFFDTARYITDSDADWTVGFIDRTGTPNPRGAAFSDPGGYGIIVFKNGVRFFVDTCEDTGVQYTFQIVGTHGRIVIDELNNQWMIRSRTSETKKLPLTRYGAEMAPVPFISDAPFDIVDLTSRALSDLLSGNIVKSSGADGLNSLEMVIALHVSDEQEHKQIRFPLRGKDCEKTVNIA